MKATPINSSLRMMGVKIRTIRRQLRMSQDRLARLSGLHRTYISDVERGVRNISLGSLQKLAKALGVSSSVLLQKAPEPPRGQPLAILLVENDPATSEPTLAALRSLNLPASVHRLSGTAARSFFFEDRKLSKGALPAGSRLLVLGLESTSIAGMALLQQIQSDPRTAAVPAMMLPACVF